MDSLRFGTPMGCCVLHYTPLGIRGLALLDAPAPRRRAAIRAEAPAFVGETVARITRHLAGEAVNLADLPLDLSAVSPFFRRVYGMARAIPRGVTVSYGELARRAGSPQASRAVGQAMARNPFLFLVPCHRVIAANGRLGGFSAPGGADTKSRLLALERHHTAEPMTPGCADARVPYDAQRALATLAARDGVLAALMSRIGEFSLRVASETPLFAAIAESIVYQQLNPKAADTIALRVRALFGGDWPEPRTFAGMAESRLRAAGLSRSKLAAMRAAAEACDRGGLCRDAVLAMSDDEVIGALSAIHGVGPWTAHMVLIFHLGRPDVLPTHDYGIRRAVGSLYFGGEPAAPEAISRVAEPWRPYRSVACWFLWRS